MGYLVFGKGTPCFEFSMAVSQIGCLERHTKTAASSHHQQTILNLLLVQLKPKVLNPKLCVLHAEHNLNPPAPIRTAPRLSALPLN